MSVKDTGSFCFSFKMDPKSMVGKICGEFKVEKLIGKGTYGLVYLVTRIDQKQTCSSTYQPTHFAMKMINSANSNSKEKVMVDREIKILRDLKKYNHKHLVKYVDFFSYESYTCIVMEYCERGTLYDYIRKHKIVSEFQFLDILRQVVAGLEFLHSKNVLHRDVKSKNILLDGHNDVKIADFGVAREMPIGPHGQLSILVGSPQYMSPEMLAQKPYDEKTDIWSLGCTCVEMGTGNYAFKAETIMEIKKLVDNKQLPPMANTDYCQEVKSLIMRMLQNESVKRPTARQVLEAIQNHKCDKMRTHTSTEIPSVITKATERTEESMSSPTRYVNQSRSHHEKQPDSGVSSGSMTSSLDNTLTGEISSTLGTMDNTIAQSDHFQKQSCKYQAQLVRLIGDNRASDKVSKIMKVLRKHSQNYNKIKETVRKNVREDRFDKIYSIVLALKGTEEAIASQSQSIDTVGTSASERSDS